MVVAAPRPVPVPSLTAVALSSLFSFLALISACGVVCLLDVSPEDTCHRRTLLSVLLTPIVSAGNIVGLQ